MTITSMISIRRLTVLLILLAAVAVAGCGGSENGSQAEATQEATTTTPTLTAEQQALVDKAAAVANAIEAAPETMVQVLADNGLTADEYKSLVYRISADPLLAQAYEAARQH